MKELRCPVCGLEIHIEYEYPTRRSFPLNGWEGLEWEDVDVVLRYRKCPKGHELRTIEIEREKLFEMLIKAWKHGIEEARRK